MIRESAIETYLVRQVILVKGEVRKVRWIGRRGAPDRLVLLPWRVCFVELKRPGKELEPHQVREHRTLRNYGVDVLKIDSFADVDELVRRN